MMFQIHYERDAERHTAEIEANSPSEAVVKFESIQRSVNEPSVSRVRVASVQAMSGVDEL